MGLQRDFDHIRLASGLDSRLTPTLEGIMKAYYVENNPQYQDNLTFTAFRNSKEVIENTYQKVVDYIGYDNFNFSDDAAVNAKLVHDFWVTFFTRNYYKALNFESYDMWATMTFAKLNELMPLYNELIKKRLTDMWLTHDVNSAGTTEGSSEGTNHGESISNSKNDSNGKTTSTTDTTGTAKETGETQSLHNNSFTDTPQNQLAISPSNPGYATTLTGDSVDGTSQSDRNDTSHSETDGTTENHAVGEVTGTTDGNTTGKTSGNTTGHDSGRDLDVFIMTQNWANSGYGVWLDIFDKLDRAPNPLFSRVMPSSKALETQEHREATYPGYRWFY